MSHFATPEGELEGRPQGSAAGPLGLASDPQFYTALGAVTLSAIDSLVRAATEGPSERGRADGSSVVAGSEPSPTRGPVVGGGSVRTTERKGASGDSGRVVQGAARSDP